MQPVMCVFPGDQRDVFSELSALRQQLRSEQKRLEGCLQQGNWEELDSPLSDRSGPGRNITFMYLVDILYLYMYMFLPSVLIHKSDYKIGYPPVYYMLGRLVS